MEESEFHSEQTKTITKTENTRLNNQISKVTRLSEQWTGYCFQQHKCAQWGSAETDAILPLSAVYIDMAKNRNFVHRTGIMFSLYDPR